MPVYFRRRQQKDDIVLCAVSVQRTFWDAASADKIIPHCFRQEACMECHCYSEIASIVVVLFVMYVCVSGI